MKKQIPFKFISLVVVLATLIIPLLNQPVSAQVDAQVDAQVSAQVDAPQSLPETSIIPEQDFWVVRVYFNDRKQVDQIAAWTEPWEINYQEGYLVIYVNTQDFNLLQAQGYRIEIDEELTALYNRPLEYLPGQITAIPGYPCYRTVEETYTTAATIATNYPNLTEWFDIGDSWEKTTPGGLSGYDMMVLRLTNETISGDKPKLFIMSAMHAREYATAELNTRFAEYLINNYEIDPDITWLLDYTEIHLLLQSNPDGRKQAETGLPWRKNTNENYCSPTSTSRGADLNRNFEFEWGCCDGSSNFECDVTYRGPSPASEPETQAIQNYVRSIFPDQRANDLTDSASDDAMGIFLDVHSYGQLMIWPWGFSSTVPPNGTQLQTLGRKLAYFNDYDPQQAYDLYPTDGTTDDFAYGDLGLASYTYELGTNFFQDCSTFENTILPKNIPSLIYAAKASRTPYMTPAGPDALNVTASPNMVAVGDQVTLEATINDTRYNNQNGTEPTQNIAAAAYYIDTPPWIKGTVTNTMSATEGVFNNSIEDVTATIDTSGFSPGRHIIFVRGQDANGNWGVVSAAFLYLNETQFNINKATSAVVAHPDDVFTYTLSADLVMTGTNSYSLMLTDTLPSEVSVLTDTIRIDGVSTPKLYISETHSIVYLASGTFTDTYDVEITLQVDVGSEVIPWTLITNQLDGQASINGEMTLPPETEEVTTLVLSSSEDFFILPIIIK